MEQKRRRLGVVLEAAAIPGGALLLFLLLVLIWKVAGLPSPDETLAFVLGLFRTHGVWIVALAALGEGVAVVNLYFPGSVVILVGVASQEGNAPGAALIVLATCTGFAIAALINFSIGYFGLHWLLERLGGRRFLSRAHDQYQQYGPMALALGYVHPNIGGLLAVAAGTAKLAWGRFLRVTLLAILAWNILFGTLVYLAADPIREVASSPVLVIIGLLVWLLFAVMLALIRSHRK